MKGKPDNKNKNPRSIEKEFNEIKKEINKKILQEQVIPSNELFSQLEKEFLKVEETYKAQNDEINLLHVQHNYFWSKSFQYLETDPTKSLQLFIVALSKLIARHELRPYSSIAFKNMSKAYMVALIKIGERKNQIDFESIKTEIISLIDSLATTSIVSDISELLNIFAENILFSYVTAVYEKKVDNLTTRSVLYEFEQLEYELTIIIDFCNQISLKRSFLLSLCHEILYKLKKKQLHFFLKKQYFEHNKQEKDSYQIYINSTIKDMLDYSRISLKSAKAAISDLSLETQNQESIRLMLTLKEIDKMAAEYYKEAYLNKDILKAWDVMDSIKQFIIIKAFRDNIPISKTLLKYFCEEWNLLSIFIKICLLEQEICKKMSLIEEDWQRELLSEIKNALLELKLLFKYELPNKKDYELKIMTSSFAGSFSEYIIYSFCINFLEYGKINENTPKEFRDLLECIKKAETKDNIKINHLIAPNKPDIDIYIKGQCAIFLKNSKIKRYKMQRIWEEIKLCEKNGIQKVFYGINFIKNMDNINTIWKFFNKIKNTYKSLYINVFDIRDLVSTFYKALKDSNSGLRVLYHDYRRLLDY